MSDRRRIAITVACGTVGWVVNAVTLPVPFSGDLGLHLGGVGGLVAAALCGPLWGLLAALVAASPFYETPWILAAEAASALLVGVAVRRGQFVLPVVTLYWLTVGPALAAAFGREAWLALAASNVLSGFAAAMIADAIVVLPAVGPRLGERRARRGFAAHLAPALTIAGVAPLLAVSLFFGRQMYGAFLAIAAVSTILALVAARILGSRISAPIREAFDGEDGSGAVRSSGNAYLAIAELADLRRRVDEIRAPVPARLETLERHIADGEIAYGELLTLSESLEARLHDTTVERDRAVLAVRPERGVGDAMGPVPDISFTLDLEGRFTATNATGERFFGQSQASLIGRHWRRTFAPGFGEDLEATGARTMLERLDEQAALTVITVHRTSVGGIRLLSSHLELVRDEDGLPLNVSGLARDVTDPEVVQTEMQGLGLRLESLRRSLDSRDRELNALLGAVRALNSELEIDQRLQHIIESAANHIRAESGFVGLLDHGVLALRWYWRSSGSVWIDLHGPGVEHGLTRMVIKSRRPYLCVDASVDPNVDPGFVKRFDIRSMLVLPIFSQSSELLGALALHNFPLAGSPASTDAGDGAGIEPSDVRFLEGLADLAAGAIQHSRLIEQVRHQAETDPLTGLYNRRVFDTRFDAELERAIRFKRSLSLVLIDIDNLKTVNDTFGHPTGDAAICAVAEVLTGRLRRHDLVARIGGEEYAALIVEAPGEQAAAVAQALCDAISQRAVPRVGRITASLGVAAFPLDATNRQELFRLADAALYTAKRSGRNRVARAQSSASTELEKA